MSIKLNWFAGKTPEMFKEATLRSFSLFNPDIKLIPIGLENHEKPVLYTSGLTVFTVPLNTDSLSDLNRTTHLNVTKHMIGIQENVTTAKNIPNFKRGVYLLLNAASIISSVKNDLITFPDKQCCIGVYPMNKIDYDTEYKKGRRVNIDKYLFAQYDTPSISDEVSYEWIS